MATATQLKQAGFSDTEITDHLQRKRQELLNAGFSQQEITEYFGVIEPEPFDFNLPPVAEPSELMELPKPVFPKGTPRDIRPPFEAPRDERMAFRAAPEPTGFLRKAFGYISPPKPPQWERASPIEKINFATKPIGHILTRIGGKITSELGLRKPEEIQKLTEDELAEDLQWYQKTPEAIGWTAEKIAEYKTLSGIFKLTGLSSVLSKVGQKLAMPFMAKELTTRGGVQTLKTLSKAGLKNLARKTLTSFLKAAPENATFISSWSAANAALQRKSLKEIGKEAAKGAGWGLGLTAGMAVVGNIATTPEVKSAAHRAFIALAKKYPRATDAISRPIEEEFLNELAREMTGQRGADVRLLGLTQRQIAQFRNAARIVKKEMQKAVQKEAATKAYWGKKVKPVKIAVKPTEVPPRELPVRIAKKPSVPLVSRGKAVEPKRVIVPPTRTPITEALAEAGKPSKPLVGKAVTAKRKIVEKKAPEIAAEGPEAIKSAAIRLPDGTIHTGYTHGEAFAKMQQKGIPLPEGDLEGYGGWLTSTGRYVSSTEANKIVAKRDEWLRAQKQAELELAKPAPAIEKAPEAPPKPTKAEIPTEAQKEKVFKIANEKGFISEKGKTKPQYRALAKAMTGQTSIAKMTKEQASDFINALNKLPEPRMVKGKLVPPSIPRTTRLVVRGQFQRVFKKPTPLGIITDPGYYAYKLGVKSLIEPLEKATQDWHYEHRRAANELDKQGALIDKVGKTTAKEKVLAKIKNIPTKAREEMGKLLDTYEEAPANLDPKKKEIFNYFRGLTRTILTRQNEARAKLDWPLIKGRKAYMRRIANDTAKEMLAGKYPFPEGIKFWSGINTGEKVFNPMEFRRKLEDDVYDLFIKDPVQASKGMMYTALKEIHLNQPLKFYKEQLNAIGKDLPEYKNLSARERVELNKTIVIPASTRRWLTEYVNTTVLGRQSKIDETVNNIITDSGLKGVFNKILRPFGRIVGRKPITRLFQKMGRLQMAGVLGPRPRIIIRNKFQLTHNLALYGLEANIRAFGPPNEELKRLLAESRFLRDYTGVEELPVDLAGKVEKLWHKGYQWSAISNARQAMEVAYWDVKNLIDNPKYKKHGWKSEHLLEEMEFGASATQFHYTALGMPQIFRHKALIPITRLTSWWQNYFSKFHREALHRILTGRPTWAGAEGPTLPWSRRLGWFRYLILGGLILNTMGYTRSYLFGAAPTGWPPAMQAAWNAYLMTVSQDEKQRATAKKRFFNAIRTFIPGYIAYKDIEAVWTGRKDLESLFFYKKRKPKEAD